VKRALLPLLLPLLLAVRADAQPPPGEAIRIYVGTYTGVGSESKGIYRLLLEPAKGSLRPEGEPTEAVSPSFLALSQDGKRLFAVNETGDAAADPAGGVSSFSLNPTSGALTPVNRNSSAGAAPCHLSLDQGDKHVLVANYWGGSVVVFPVQPDGRLGGPTSFVRHVGENPTPRDPGPHAHAVQVDPGNRFALVADLGLDKLFVYPYDAERGALGDAREVPLAKGAGPRHLAFHPDGKSVYVLNELSGTVTAFAYDPKDGSLRELQTATTLRAGFTGQNSSAEVAVSPDGRFLFASNRGPDEIATFRIDPASRKLELLRHQATGGQHPRHFAIDPTGSYLVVANRDSDSVVVFAIDSTTGMLSHAAGPVHVPKPACVLMRKAAP
jgi:6-phosphogluconolactonase